MVNFLLSAITRAHRHLQLLVLVVDPPCNHLIFNLWPSSSATTFPTWPLNADNPQWPHCQQPRRHRRNLIGLHQQPMSTTSSSTTLWPLPHWLPSIHRYLRQLGFPSLFPVPASSRTIDDLMQFHRRKTLLQSTPHRCSLRTHPVNVFGLQSSSSSKDPATVC